MAYGEQTSLADRKRRAGQRLLVGLAGTGLDQGFRNFVRSTSPAGFILFKRNVESPEQVCELNRELAAAVRDDCPALLSVDQEGGRVQRVREIAWPPLRTVGNVDHIDSTAAFAQALADEVRAMGFNLNFAPVADVDSNPANPVIGDRSFGRDPAHVARHVATYVRATQSKGLIACAKHFPGHGDTTVDSHLALPIVEKELPELFATELVPFRAAKEAGVGMVMTAHVVFPALDEDVPATMSHKIISGLLREEVDFQGVVISDDLEMKAVRGRYPLELQLDLACRATVDLFCISESLELCWEAFETLVRLQENDPVHDALAQQSENRINALRERFFVDSPPAPELTTVGSVDHRLLAETLRQRGGDGVS